LNAFPGRVWRCRLRGCREQVIFAGVAVGHGGRLAGCWWRLGWGLAPLRGGCRCVGVWVGVTHHPGGLGVFWAALADRPA
jgi:hypothetical protein